MQSHSTCNCMDGRLISDLKVDRTSADKSKRDPPDKSKRAQALLPSMFSGNRVEDVFRIMISSMGVYTKSIATKAGMLFLGPPTCFSIPTKRENGGRKAGGCTQRKPCVARVRLRIRSDPLQNPGFNLRHNQTIEG